MMIIEHLYSICISYFFHLEKHLLATLRGSGERLGLTQHQSIRTLLDAKNATQSSNISYFVQKVNFLLLVAYISLRISAVRLHFKIKH